MTIKEEVQTLILKLECKSKRKSESFNDERDLLESVNDLPEENAKELLPLLKKYLMIDA